jgi:hypothetical protein
MKLNAMRKTFVALEMPQHYMGKLTERFENSKNQ